MIARHIQPRPACARRAGGLLVAALLAGVLPACRSSVASTPTPGLAGPGGIVLVQRPRLTVPLPAELSPYQEVAMQARVPGFIRRLYVHRGSRVQHGQLLADIEAPDLVAQRAEAAHRVAAARELRVEAEATLEKDRGTLARLLDAATAGAVAGNDLHVAQQTVAADADEVASRRAAQDAAVQALQAQATLAGYLRATAPFGGVVTRRMVSAGALVGPTGTPLFDLQPLDPLRLVVDVQEQQAVGIELGDRVSFTVTSAPDRSFAGTVARIAHSLRRETRTMPVELDVPNPRLELAPGMYAHVNWPLRRDQPTLFVPGAAVVRGTENAFVEVVRGGRVAYVTVTLGFSTDTQMEVFGQLRGGELVVVPGDDELRPGARVSAATVGPPAR